MGPIFINDDDGEFITASVKQLGRIKFFIHTASAGARRQHRPRIQLNQIHRIKHQGRLPLPRRLLASRSTPKINFCVGTGFQRPGRLLRPRRFSCSRHPRLQLSAGLGFEGVTRL